MKCSAFLVGWGTGMRHYMRIHGWCQGLFPVLLACATKPEVCEGLVRGFLETGAVDGSLFQLL